MTDRDYLRWLVNPARFGREYLGFQLDRKQTELLELSPNFCLLNCTRQWGKSSVTAIKALHHAMFHEKSLTLVMSPCLRQSEEFMKKVKAFLHKVKVPARRDSGHSVSVVLPNGSRILGLPAVEDTARGYSGATLLIVDEAAGVEDEMYKAMTPATSVSRGDIWLLSTPRGVRGFFHQFWVSRDADWTRMAVPARECPRLDEDFLEKERAHMGARWFEQEYCCAFLDGDDALFPSDFVRKALRDDIPPYVV